MNLSAFEANYQPTAIAKPEQTKKLSGVTGLAVNFLPTIAGGAGAALGSFVGPVGTAVGGAAGAGLGEYLRQKLTGEASDGIDKGNIVQESIFGALPGVSKGIKAVKTARAAEGGLAGAGGLRGVLTGGKLAKAAEEVVPGAFRNNQPYMRGVEDIVRSAEKPKSIPIKYIDEISTGSAKPENIKKTFAGADAAQEATTMRNNLAGKGFSVTGKTGTIKGVSGTPANPKAAKAFVSEYADYLKSIDDDLTGGQILSDNAGGYKRISEHTKFYRDTFASKKRAPTKTEWLEEAKRQIDSGTADPFAQSQYAEYLKPNMQPTNTKVFSVEGNRISVPLDTNNKTAGVIMPKNITPNKITATRSNSLQPVNTAENTITRATETAADARTRAAERFTGGSNGIKPGAKVGSQTLTAKRSAELNAHINANIGAKPTDAADTILRRNEAFIANKASELDSLLSQKNTLLEPNDYRKVISGIKKPTGMNLVDNPTHLQLASDLQNVTDVKGLEKFRREIDDIVNFSRSEASPDPATERVALAWRKAIDKVVTNKIPESKEIKTALNRAFDTKTFIEPAARNAGGFGYGNIKIGGRALQGAKRATGQALDKLPDAIGVNLPKLNGNSFLARTAKAAIPQQGYRIGAEMLGIPPTNEQPVEQTSNTSLPTAETNGMTGSPAVDMLQSSTAGMPTLEQVQAYLASGGKIDDVAKYVALAEKLSPASKTKPLNSTAAGIVSDIENGIANIRSLEADVTDNSANGPIAGRLRALNPYDTEAQGLQANLARVKQLIGKALEGGVLRKEDEEKYNKILPTIKDTDTNAVYKINQIANDLERKLGLYKQNLGQGSGGLDINALIAQ